MGKMIVIGILGSILLEKENGFLGYERAYVNNDYINAVIAAGAVPFIIPISFNDEVIKNQISLVDGIILSGGYDVNPIFYGQEPHQKLTDIYPIRDEFDMKIFKLAMEMKKPILGICRGCQLMNVVNGGTLHQDLSLIEGCYIKHSQGHTPSLATHSIDVVQGTKLEEILERDVFVNSFHHQAIDKVGDGFKVAAVSKDGVIEAIEWIGDEFILGVQWHPEMLAKKSSKMLNIFLRLVEECKRLKIE